MEELVLQIAGNYPNKSRFVNLFIDDVNQPHPCYEKLADLDSNLEYVANSKILSPCYHYGQRKLLLSEIQFLTKFMMMNKEKNNENKLYCLYVGSAPGNKTHILSQLFPEIIFILIDPAPFNIMIELDGNVMSHRKLAHPEIYTFQKENGVVDYVSFIKSNKYKIYILEDYFTNELARHFASLDPASLLFISDIRTNIYSGGTSYPGDNDIIWNTAMMFNWLSILRPFLSVIKFRMPFYTAAEISVEVPTAEFDICREKIDFISNYKNRQFVFCRGEIYLQAWPGISSTESRLHIRQQDIDNIIEYYPTNIDNRFFYYNKINRGNAWHENENANKEMAFCHCADCALENKIWSDYCEYNPAYTVLDLVKKTNKITGKSLLNHKCIFKMPDYKLIKSLY